LPIFACPWRQAAGTLQQSITSTALRPNFPCAHDHIRLWGRRTLRLQSRPSTSRSPHPTSLHQTSWHHQRQHQYSITCLPIALPPTICHCHTSRLPPRLPTFPHECRQNMQ
jgi:hypothetical protein